MKKKVLLLFLLFFSVFQSCNAMEEFRDTNRKSSWIRNFNLAFNYVEIGKVFRLNQKDFSQLNYGIEEYMSNVKGGIDAGGFGVALYFKDKIGFEVLYSFQDFYGTEDPLMEYVTAKQPNYFSPDYVSSFGDEASGLGFRICYRKHFKHFFIEPRLQFKPNNLDHSTTSFRMKEKGSNHFIQYTVDNVIHGRNDSYHLMLNFARKFDPFKSTVKWEMGILTDFMIRPVKRTVTITEQPYGQQQVSNAETFSMINPAIGVKLSLKVYFGYKPR